MPPWCEFALVAATPVVIFVAVMVVNAITTKDTHDEDVRVDAETLHRIRKDDAR